ncbi:MAG: archease [Candidatus Omnitrophica bacterium]|nr:archease [Candidatus Omnitrophota bacterium]MCB9719306.1 archease [Candidatus Omnitrophota bacterium]
MPYRFLDDVATADIAFEATGRDLNEIFRAAAAATLAVMLEDIPGLEDRVERTVVLDADDPQELLFRFLQEVIFYKDAECLLLRVRELNVTGDGRQLRAVMSGEAVDIERHCLNVDIKAVTYHLFTFKETAEGYVTTVVLDI